MNRFPFPAAAMALVLAAAGLAPAAHATVVADFELNGSLANAAAGPARLDGNGGALGATGIGFGTDAGPTLSGLGALSAYTIDVGFTLDRLTGGFDTPYVKLLDFSGLGADAGYYSNQGHLSAFPLQASSTKVFTAGTPVRLTLSRDAVGLITAYVDGTRIYSQTDTGNLSGTVIDGIHPLHFFTDDRVTDGHEAAAGFVDYIRVADTALTPGQISPVPSAVPEPASWALMLAGMAAVGAALRSRRRREIADLAGGRYPANVTA